jgi:RNA polymerase sigma factor (TIGR02999 family)
MPTMGEITTLIRAASSGDERAFDRLFTLLYDDMHRLAHARLKRGRPITVLDTTSLVHEGYLRFVKAGELDVNDRGHFLAYAARVMRSIVVDFARKRQAERRGGGALKVTLDTGIAEAVDGSNDEIIRVHEVLDELKQVDAELARLVEMRYFAGLKVGEIAEAFGVTERTIERQWQKARAILFAAIN